MKIAVIFANGTEEIEALTVVDVVRRCNVKCDIVGLTKKVVGSHNVAVESDLTIDKANLIEYDAIVIPGGMPGAINIANEDKIISALNNLYQQGKLIAGICASPAVVFAQRGIAKGKKMTCYPAQEFIDLLKDSYVEKSVVVDGNVITANGPKSAMEFSLSICSALNINPKF